MTIPQFQKIILDWWHDPRTRASSVRGRLPWRRTRDPYRILVSEIMLQQTQVSRVLPKYKEFLRAFPTLKALAKAPDKKLLKVWTGLGYWRRAKYLKETAKILVKRARAVDLRRRVGPRSASWRSGVKRDEKTQLERFFPRGPKELQKLPGIGHYTARALACFSAQGGPPPKADAPLEHASGGASCEAFLDTNIRRVYLHFFFAGEKDVPDKKILEIAQKATTSLRIYGKLKYAGVTPREWHYALFDYGATVLNDKTINKRSRHYHKQSKFAGSFRSFRTKAMHFLLAQPKNKVEKKVLGTFLKKELYKPFASAHGKQLYTPKQIIDALLKDNLIRESKTHFLI